MACVFAPAAFETTDDADGHIVIAKNLTAQPHPRKVTRREEISFGDRHLLWFACHELHAASGAPCVSAAGM
jgi:hypothetical protein